jgi:hypothetical protein
VDKAEIEVHLSFPNKEKHDLVFEKLGWKRTASDANYVDMWQTH